MAFPSEIEAICSYDSEVFLSVSGGVESWDAITLKGSGLAYQFSGRVTALAASPCGLMLAAIEGGRLYILLRGAREGVFAVVTSVEIVGNKVVWMKRFGVACYGGEVTTFISPGDGGVLGKIDLPAAAVTESDQMVVLSSISGDVFFWDGERAMPSPFQGEVLCSFDSSVLLHLNSKCISIHPPDPPLDLGDFPILTKACEAVALTPTGFLLFHPAEAIRWVGDSPAIALFTKETVRATTSPTLSSNATPHFSTETFEFEKEKGVAISLPKEIASGLDDLSTLSLIDRRQKQARVRGDLDEIRFWTLVKGHEGFLKKSASQQHNISVVSTLSLDTVKRTERRGTPKSTSRIRPGKPMKTPPRKTKPAPLHTKNSFSTPVRAKQPNKTVTTRSTAKLPSLSAVRPGCLSEKKIRPEQDVFKLAMDTSALLKSCFDSNRKRGQVLVSDGESQVTDLLMDYSDVDGPSSCKSESPSPCGARKHSDSRTASDLVFTTGSRPGDLCFSSAGVVCRELLGTGSDKPEFPPNIYKACVIASSVSPAFHQTILYEAAQRLSECCRTREAVELLCLCGRQLEACSLMQGAGMWSEALALARRSLRDSDIKDTIANWVGRLCTQREFLEAVRVSIEQEQPELVIGILKQWEKGELAAAYVKYCQGELGDAPSQGQPGC